MCKRCIAQEPIRQRKSSDCKMLRRDPIRKVCSNVDSSSFIEVQPDTKTLPYNVSNLLLINSWLYASNCPYSSIMKVKAIGIYNIKNLICFFLW